MNFWRLAGIFLFFSAIFLFAQTKVFAQGEFTSDYKVNYAIEPSGRTNVVQEITLKNNTPNFYADKFELKIGSTKVDNVKAQDASGPMTTNVSFDNNVTTISVKFNQRVIGLGKTLPWKLFYSSSELVTKSGQIWEISIPKIAKNPDIGIYQVQVFAPITFGPVAASVPTPKLTSRQGENQIFEFEKDQLLNLGISMLLGEKQIFQFTLSYYLDNNNLTARTKEITLPPDNNYQKIVISSINPAPINVRVDSEGNFLAQYKLSPRQQSNIVVSGYVEVFTRPFRNTTPKLSSEDRKRYIQPQRYWETDSAIIKDKANELAGPKEIYDFVSNYLSYSQERLNTANIERKGALAAFNDPKDSVCMEFTDLFITLARAKGIPAREVVGYAYSQNERLRPLSFTAQGDLLHAWPQFWDDKQGWIQVDPTWGSTSGGLDYFDKMDFNHITLVQRGASSTTPFPAGSFKKPSQLNKKDVIVSFAQDLPNITNAPQLSLITPEKIIAGIPVKILAQIKNIGSTSIISGMLILESNALAGNKSQITEVGILPPFSKKEFSYNFQTKSSFSKVFDVILLSFADAQISKPITITPLYFLIASKLFLISLVFALLIIIVGLVLYKKLHQTKVPKTKDLL